MTQQRTTFNNDRYPFWGTKTPKEIKYLRDVCNNKIDKLTIDRDCFRDLLKLAVNSIETSDATNNGITHGTFAAVCKQYSIENPNGLLSFYSGLAKLVKMAFKYTNLKLEYMREDLKDILKFPNDYVNDFLAVITSQQREVFERGLLAMRPQYNNKIKLFQWRIDVSISTSALCRTLEPAIIVRIKLSDGSIRVFEMSIKKFHLLRFNIATILKEIEDLEGRQMFKLCD